MDTVAGTPNFTVYTKPSCVQCTATKREIGKMGGTFDEIDLTHDEEALAEFKAQGLAQAPIVVGPDGSQWTGFRPDLIKMYRRKDAA